MPLPPVQALPPPPPPPPITIPVYFPQLTPVPYNGPNVPQMVPPPQLQQSPQQQQGFPLPPLQPFQPTNVAPPGYPFQLPQQPFQLPRIY